MIHCTIKTPCIYLQRTSYIFRPQYSSDSEDNCVYKTDSTCLLSLSSSLLSHSLSLSNLRSNSVFDRHIETFINIGHSTPPKPTDFWYLKIISSYSNPFYSIF